MGKEHVLEKIYVGQELLSFYDYLVMKKIATTNELDGNVSELLDYYDRYQDKYQRYCLENEYDYEVID